MSTFAAALNAIKTNPRSLPDAPPTKSKEIRRSDDGHSKSGSILDRIKLNKPTVKPIKKITIHKNDSDDEDRMKVIHKVIKKEKSIEIHRPVTKKGDIEGQWKHDKYDGPVKSSNSIQATVFVRNLPDFADKDSLMGLCRDYDSVIGIKIDSGTAEINFSKSDQARKASEALNGKMFRGSKLKAAILSEINERRETTLNKMREEKAKEKEDSFKKTHMDKVGSDNKTSILNRIKKAY